MKLFILILSLVLLSVTNLRAQDAVRSGNIEKGSSENPHIVGIVDDGYCIVKKGFSTISILLYSSESLNLLKTSEFKLKYNKKWVRPTGAFEFANKIHVTSFYIGKDNLAHHLIHRLNANLDVEKTTEIAIGSLDNVAPYMNFIHLSDMAPLIMMGISCSIDEETNQFIIREQ